MPTSGYCDTCKALLHCEYFGAVVKNSTGPRAGFKHRHADPWRYYRLNQVVEFTSDNLGAMTLPYDGPKAVTEVIMMTGDLGKYIGPHGQWEANDLVGWHIIEVNRKGTDGYNRTRFPLYVPVHKSQFTNLLRYRRS